jgi:hypothetical protein
MTATYLFIVSMDVDPAHEALFNEVYDTEHVPNLLKVPGVLGVRRYRSESFEVVIGGERKLMTPEGEPTYTAIYEIENPSVLTSNAWAEAVDQGRWPGVRPHTSNRRHSLKRLMT